jgi:DMSO/TMAO reductase YedYZ molybdopterin-dependent catalytic subunit
MTGLPSDTLSAPDPPSRSLRIASAGAGILAAGAGLATAELIAGLVAGAPSALIAIGDLVIDLQPPGAKDVVVGLFGTNDKAALDLLVLVGALAIAAALGMVGRRRPVTAALGVVALGGLVAFAALREPLVDPLLAVVAPALGTLVALGVLGLLLGALEPLAPRAGEGADPGRPATRPLVGQPALPTRPMPDWDRRRFLRLGATVAVGSVALGALGRSLLTSAAATARPVPPALARVLAPAPALAPGSSLDVPGITPIVMPAERFYRIDTALLTPRVDVATWTLRISGMVERELSLTYDELVGLPTLEQYVTIACVSNVVGGDLVGNALWSGVHLRDVLGLAGVRAAATQLVGRSVDGFTVGFPTAWAMDQARDPMIALGMNGQPLPPEHGSPARLIVPGLYGYVSATKWLAEIELTTLEAFDAYWVRLGWAKEAPILTQSRIDLPRDGARLPAGSATIAGVAWAPDRGISAVELRIDGGPWQAATISTPISRATWVQWRTTWSATPGSHTLEVRATDGTGAVQTAEVSPPAPDGARGHHRITVTVG